MSDSNKRNSDFGYGVYDRGSDLADVGNPTVKVTSGSGNRVESQLSNDRVLIEECVKLLDNKQDHNVLLTWLCSHKQDTFSFLAHAIISLVIWQHYFLEKYHANIEM
jgi:hypothetical protein